MCDELPHEMTLDDTYLRKGRGVIDLTRDGLTWFSKRWHLRRRSQGGYTNKSRCDRINTKCVDVVLQEMAFKTPFTRRIHKQIKV